MPTCRILVRYFLFSCAVLLSSCIMMPRQVPFDETAFAPYRGTGTGVVDGKLYSVDLLNQVSIGSDNTMHLVPVTPYTNEFIEREIKHGESLGPADSRLSKYVWKTQTNGGGYFKFTGIPPGKYYLTCYMKTYDATDPQPTVQWIYSLITVKNGYTTTVTDWGQGATWLKQLAHGNIL